MVGPRRQASTMGRVAGPCVALVLCGAAASAGDPLFPQPSVLLAKPGAGAKSLDANDDGLPDLVRLDSDGLLLIATTSPFALLPPVRIQDGLSSHTLLVGDFDSDGESDVASVAWSALDVLAGAGDGSFDPVFHLDLVNSETAALLDADADGNLDLLIATYQGDVLPALGDGSGGFRLGPGVPLVGDRIATGDVDADGYVDFVATFDSTVEGVTVVARGDGTGQFAPWMEYPTLYAVLTGLQSLDDDGWLDLVWVSWLASGPQIQLSLGGGVFGPPVQPAGAAKGGSLLFGDFDEDGDTDLLSGKLLLNDGAGTFAGEPGDVEDPTSELATDLDADGLLDLVAAMFIEGPDDGYGTLWGNGTLFVKRGRPGPTFEVPLESEQAADVPEAMLLADLDADGADDVVLAQLEEVHVLPGSGDGHFGAGIVSIVNTGYGSCVARAAGDFDGDGLLDLLGSYDKLQIPVPKGVRLLHGLGDGTVVQGVNSLSPGQIVDIDVADLDLDGDLDPVLHKVGELATLLNDGSGKMLPGATADADEFSDVALGDADGDGFPDVVLARQLLDLVQVLPGMGDGQLGAALEAVVVDARSVALGDLDGDGRDEIAVGQANNEFAQTDLALLQLQPGLGLVQLGGQDLPGLDSFGANVLDVRDVTGDGYEDVLLSSSTDVSVVASDGAAGLLPARSFHAGGGTPLVGLVDGDAFADVVTVQFEYTTSAVLRTSPGHPSGPWTDLGHALAGAKGTPTLAGFGSLLEHAPISLQLAHAAPAAAAWLLLGTQAALAPFKGGTLVPLPSVIVSGLTTDAQGRIQLSGSWSASVPMGSTFVVQAWIVDPVGPAGFAATNGLQLIAP